MQHHRVGSKKCCVVLCVLRCVIGPVRSWILLQCLVLRSRHTDVPIDIAPALFANLGAEYFVKIESFKLLLPQTLHFVNEVIRSSLERGLM